MAYQPGVPTGTVALNADYLNLQENFTQLNDQWLVDHVPLTTTSGTPPNGYHTIIHEVTQTSVNTVAGFNQIFSGIPGTLVVNAATTAAIPNNNDTQLYSLTGMGGLSQLTGHKAASNGYVWCSGLLFQWGVLTFGSRTGIITFSTSGNVAFPNNIFNVQATMKGTSGTANNMGIGAISNANFSYSFTGTASSSFTGFYWFAIGN